MGTGELRLGVVGLGMGRTHIAEFLAHPGCDVVALADVDEARLTAAGERFGVAELFLDPENMFDSAALDAVSLAVPNCLHLPLTLAALDRGLHVLCEKPMAMNVAEAEAMKAAADRAGKTLMINFSFRFSEVSQALKQQVDAAALGQVYFGRTVWHRFRGVPRPGSWFGRKEMSGGGPLIDLGVHRIDLALWLMGYPEPMSVSGSTHDRVASRLPAIDDGTFTVEDLACGMIRFHNGASLLVETSWARNFEEPEFMVTELYGDRGGLRHRNVNGGYDMTAEVFVAENEQLVKRELGCSAARVRSSYGEFVDSILEQRMPSATAEQGIAVQRILEGLYRSASDQREVILG